MALHSKNIALAAGVPTYLVEEVVKYMRVSGRIGVDTAKEYIKAHHIFSNIRKKEHKGETPLSTFFVEFKPKRFDE